MIDQKLLVWIFIMAALGAGGLWLLVIGDLWTYRNLQKRLKAEREDPHEGGAPPEKEDENGGRGC